MNFYIFNNGLITNQEGYSGSDRRAYEWTKIRIFDSSRISKELGYKQEYGLVEGISRTIKWYRRDND